MFRAITRFLRAVGYLLTGRIDAARKSLSADPDVIRSTYDAVIQEKSRRIQQYKEAVGAMIAQEEKKKIDLKSQSEEIARLRQLKEGAAAMARKVVERHGGDSAAVKRDPEYAKCQQAFGDFSTTIADREARCAQLESEIADISQTVGQHKLQLQSLLRDLEKIRQEKHETVADMITAREERQVADMLSGLSQDRTSQELQELRDLRRESKASARVSRELAGLEAQRSETDFLEYATKAGAVSEFGALIGLARDQSEPPPAAPEKTRIPEG